MISGTIYVVLECWYCGIGGDTATMIAAYTSERAAINKVERLNLYNDYPQSQYDQVWYEYKPVELVC